MAEFKIDPEGVDPKSVPQRKLYTGATIPGVGMGTFGSDRFTHEEVATAVLGGASVGYRHFDCAAIYGNEDKIGESFRIMMEGGIKREELFITSKLWNDKHSEEDVIPTCKQSLKDLGLDYLNLYLTHWPFPNFHPIGCDVDSRSPDAKPYIHENFMKTWRKMEELVDLGLVKHIGTSNMTVAKMKLVLRDCRIKPAVNEMELHPHFQQDDLYTLCKENGIVPIGFCPIGSPTRPDRDKTADDTVDIEDPVIVKIAKDHGVHPAVICVKWATQRWQVPIPFSIHKNEYISNLKCATEDFLSDAEMEAIKGINKNNRLIKGQVFLWKEDQTWEDLWDLDGNISQ